jgi:hypothetical protein
VAPDLRHVGLPVTDAFGFHEAPCCFIADEENRHASHLGFARSRIRWLRNIWLASKVAPWSAYSCRTFLQLAFGLRLRQMRDILFPHKPYLPETLRSEFGAGRRSVAREILCRALAGAVARSPKGRSAQRGFQIFIRTISIWAPRAGLTATPEQESDLRSPRRWPKR